MVFCRFSRRAAGLVAASITFALFASDLPAQQKQPHQSILSRRTKRFEDRAMSLDQQRLAPEPEAPITLLPADDERRTYSVSVPWTNDQGEQLAAISGDRKMTIGELRSRVALVEQGFPPIQHPSAIERRTLEEERRVQIGEKILEAWVETATLAQEAELRGYKVTEQEIQESIAQLMQPAPGGGPQTIPVNPSPARQAIGIPQDQLRAETRDSILIEKFINDVMKAWYDQAFYERLYKQEPSAFLIPPRVRAFHIFRMLPPGISERDQKHIRKELEGLRKELRKKNPDYSELERMSNASVMLSAGDMGWITADAVIHPAMHNALFGLEPGETSEIFETSEQAFSTRGLHVVRVVERDEGSQRTLEAAMPQLKNYTFGKTKHLVFEQISPAYDASFATGGLMRTQQMTKAEYENYKRSRLQANAPTPRAASPAASALKADRNSRAASTPGAASPPPVVLDPRTLNPGFRGDSNLP